MPLRTLGTTLVLIALCAAVLAASPARRTPAPAAVPAKSPPPLRVTPTPDGIGRVSLSDAEWKQRLSPAQFQVLRQQGTEIAFTGAYWNTHAKGTYECAACGLPLFSSQHKFDSGTGWPSFWQAIAAGHVRTASDTSLGMTRDELACARCGGHLGHVFSDGPAPTGQRYCIDSISLQFKPAR